MHDVDRPVVASIEFAPGDERHSFSMQQSARSVREELYR